MEFKQINNKMTGVAIPVSALRSKKSEGIGDFLDLIELGKWCKTVGLDLIQILPVNDTGFGASPYSALSAYALHPVYTRIADLPGAEEFKSEISAFKKKYNDDYVHFEATLKWKLELLQRLFEKAKLSFLESTKIKAWIKENPWIKDYAVFSHIRSKHAYAHWKEWPENSSPDAAERKAYWESNKNACYFYVFTQYHLEKQFLQAAEYLDKNELTLKGDIPIMMNDDSVDVWANRNYFRLNMSAGAPPDGFNPAGQNWGFPIYDWSELKKDNYQWWKDRLKQANKFYHAYRIDHVLGFFRLWTVSSANSSGALGYFRPSRLISKTQLIKSGFGEDRINWLSKSHIYKHEIEAVFGQETENILDKIFERIGSENLYLFKPSISGEKMLEQLEIPDIQRDTLLYWFRERSLIEVKKGAYAPNVNKHDVRSFVSLAYNEKEHLNQIFQNAEEISKAQWEAQGRELLGFMQSSYPMLVCAEDLGAIPDCVPKVLSELKILGLKINRWTKKWQTEPPQYIHIKHYPERSVCTPSVHDTSTLRDWWNNECSREERIDFCHSIGMSDPVIDSCTEDLAYSIIEHLLAAKSMLVIFQIQDLFSLSEALCTEDPSEERINVPGTLNSKNWNYRIIPKLEDLKKQDAFNEKLQALVQKRKEYARLSNNKKKLKQ